MTIRRRLAIISFAMLIFPFLLMALAYLLVIAPLKHGEIIDFDFMPPAVYNATLQFLEDNGKSGILDDNGVIGIMYADGFLYLNPSLSSEIKDNPGISIQSFISRSEAWPFDKTIGISRFSFRDKNGTVFFRLDQTHPGRWLKDNSASLILFLLMTLFVFPSILSYILLMGLRKDLSHLVDGAEKISAGALDFDLVLPKDKAIRPVFTAFEDMRTRLSENQTARKRFLTAISHDLKTPLTSIKGYLEVLQDGMEESPEEREKYYKILRDKSDLLEQRIQELIDFARMEEVDWKQRFEKIDAKAFFDEIFAVFSDEARSRGRNLECVNRAAEGTILSGDRNMLFRVFENLLENGYRYTRDDDRISCRIGQEKGRLRITVSDNGPGIPPEDRKRVFEPFFRGENSRNSYGVGLGLSTVKSIIDAHQGSITIDESESGGTCFIILLNVE